MKAPAPTDVAQAAQKLAFYEWAYGRLGENDDGQGPLALHARADGRPRQPVQRPDDHPGADGLVCE